MTEEKEQYEVTHEVMAALPEAPASATVRCLIEGFDWMVTIREFDGTNPGRQLLSKLKAINAELKKMGADPAGNNYRSSPPPKPKKEAPKAPAPKAEPEEPDPPTTIMCPEHGVEMELKDGKWGPYYSHKVAEGKWCNLKVEKARKEGVI